MASNEYIGLARLTQVFTLLKTIFDAKADATALDNKILPAFGTCSTAADQRVKNVSISDSSWKLKTGCIIGVKFTYSNTYNASSGNAVQLNVNSTGAKNIYYANTNNPTGTNTTAFGRAKQVNYYQYDGTNWVWISGGQDNNSTYGSMSQAEATTGTSTTGRTISAKVLNDTILEKGGGSGGTDISEVNYNNLPDADKTNGSTYYVY